MDKIEERLSELELWFIGCHIPYVGSQRDNFVAKMRKVDSDYAKDVVSKIEEYWRLIKEQNSCQII